MITDESIYPITSKITTIVKATRKRSAGNRMLRLTRGDW